MIPSIVATIQHTVLAMFARIALGPIVAILPAGTQIGITLPDGRTCQATLMQPADIRRKQIRQRVKAFDGTPCIVLAYSHDGKWDTCATAESSLIWIR